MPKDFTNTRKDVEYICSVPSAGRFLVPRGVVPKAFIAHTGQMHHRDGQPAPFATPFMIGQEDKRTMKQQINAAVGYKGPVKKELLKDADVLHRTTNGDLQ